MKVDVRKNVRTPQNAATNFRLIKDGIENFKSVFDYQKFMLSRILWVSKPTVVRIVPGNDGEQTYKQVVNTTNWTSDAAKTDFLSDTFYMTQTLASFGDNRLDICSNLDPESEEASLYPESPLNFFANTVHRVIRAVNNGKKTKIKYNERWKAWTNMRGKLPFPKPTLFFQGIIQEVNGVTCTKGEDNGNEPGYLYGLIGINHTASINALLKALVDPMDRRKPIGVENNNYGSLAEVEGNMLFLNASEDTNGKMLLEPSIQSADAPQSEWNPTPFDLTEEGCKSLWVPWNKLLRYLTVQEQLELIAREFGADTLNYVFSLDNAWEGLAIPERIKAVGLGQYGEAKAPVVAKCPAHKPKNLFDRNATKPPIREELGDDEEDEEPIYQSHSVRQTRGIDMNAMKAKMDGLRAAKEKVPQANNIAEVMSGIDDTDLSDLDDDDLGDIGL